MQLITFLSAATALVASSVADRTAVTLNQECDHAKPYARIINRCDYPVHLWSVAKGTGCPGSGMLTLQKGETYSENYDNPSATDGVTGVSIKVSKTQQCKGSDIVQLEYFLQQTGDYQGNYLDVSYVDCLGNNCPTKSEGFYLVAGNQTGSYAANSGNTWCPVLSCNDAVSCAKMAYILPDDVQTKTCALNQSMDFYMCGGNAPTEDYDTPSAAPVNTPKKSSTPAAPTPSSSKKASTDIYKVNAAAVTQAPGIKEVEKHQKTRTQVKVVYVTEYAYVNAKRHAHGHARRHQPFHA